MTPQLTMKQTPLAKLQYKKRQILLESTLQEQKINEHFSYMKENAGSLVFSGLSSLLFSGSKSSSSSKNNKEQSLTTTEENSGFPFGVLNYLSIGKSLLPLAWEIAQPFVITWGLKSVRKLLTGFFTKKKKTTV